MKQLQFLSCHAHIIGFLTLMKLKVFIFYRLLRKYDTKHKTGEWDSL